MTESDVIREIARMIVQDGWKAAELKRMSERLMQAARHLDEAEKDASYEKALRKTEQNLAERAFAKLKEQERLYGWKDETEEKPKDGEEVLALCTGRIGNVELRDGTWLATWFEKDGEWAIAAGIEVKVSRWMRIPPWDGEEDADEDRV